MTTNFQKARDWIFKDLKQTLKNNQIGIQEEFPTIENRELMEFSINFKETKIAKDLLQNLKTSINKEILNLKKLQRKAEAKYRTRLPEKRLLLEQNARLENEGKIWEVKENKKIIKLIDEYKEKSLTLSGKIESFKGVLHRIGAIEEQDRLKDDLFELSGKIGKLYWELLDTSMNIKTVLGRIDKKPLRKKIAGEPS